MREVQVPGGKKPDLDPAQRWSVEMDEFDAVRELRERYSGSVEEVLDFIRGEWREMPNRAAEQIIAQLQGDTNA